MIVLVRHGETVFNRERKLLGRYDPPLTERGEAQIAALARTIARLDPTAVVTSPMTRTRVTADAIGAAAGLAVETDERLVEIDYGEYDGVALDDLPADVLRAMRDDPDFTPPGGESMRLVMQRMADWCQEHVATGEDRVVVAVSHVSPIKAAVAWTLGVEPNLGWRMFVGLASITRIGGATDRPVLLSFNEQGHLDGEGLTGQAVG